MTNTLLERAKKIMPGGVSSPVRALKSVGGEPLFIVKARGANFWDIDNKKFIDLCMSFGPLILGHAHDKIVSSIKNAAEKGTSYGISSPYEVDLAEKIVESHSATEWVRFVNSGTEAVMSALRLARGYTNRNMIIKFAGCYHGHTDSMLVKAGSGLATFGISSSAGVPSNVSKNTVVLPLGNLELVKQAVENHGEDIAAIIVEGVPANNGLLIQSNEYMKGLETISRDNGSLFLVDEVITGFRLGLGGATDYYKIKPDLVTFGKVIGGGLPIGAYGGKKELMESIAPLGDVYQAGTLSGNPLAMAAGNVTLDILRNTPVYNELENLGQKFANDITNIFDELAFPFSLRRFGSIIWPILQANVEPVNPDEISNEAVDNYSKLHKSALKEGIYLPPSAFEVAFLSTAHTDQIIEEISSKLKLAGSNL